MKTSYVYILTNKGRTVFYTGITADLINRMTYHKVGKGSEFCAKYNVNILVYYEIHANIRDAIKRETQVKRWNRQWNDFRSIFLIGNISITKESLHLFVFRPDLDFEGNISYQACR